MKNFGVVSLCATRLSNAFFASSVASLVATSAIFLFLFSNVGCDRSEKSSRHGSSQLATSKEKESQYRSLIDQAVLVTEEQEEFPDFAYLRGTVGRLNSWLVERAKSEDFEPDAEFAQLADECRALASTAKRAAELVALFRNEMGKPSEKDADELQAIVDRAQSETDALAEKLDSSALRAFGIYINELRSKLANAKEFQFADATETFQTQIRQFTESPFLNFETLSGGLDDFARLLQLDGRAFLPQDADALRETIWTRNVYNWAKGEKQDDATIVKNLFDWSVENVVLTRPFDGPAGPVSQLGWQTLLTSQGTPLDRALVFIEMLRQHRLDAFVLRPVDETLDNFPLIVGVCIKGEVYLFAPELGLPIPGPGADAISLADGLSFDKIATLSQVADDDSILRKLDFDAERPFPATAAQFANVVALVPSTPFQASERALFLQQEFSGNVVTVLATPFASQKARIAQIPQIAAVERLQQPNAAILEHIFFPIESELLTRPYRYALTSAGNLEIAENSDDVDESIADYTRSGADGKADVANPTEAAGRKKSAVAPLWRGKILYLKGAFVEESGAAHWLQQGRVSDRMLKQEESQLSKIANDYVGQFVEANRAQNREVSEDEIRAFAEETIASLQLELAMKHYVKIASKFYLALLSNAVGNDETAVSHLKDPSLQRSDNFWAVGGVYLLARILEREGNYAAAVRLLQTKQNETGWLLRAKWLAELADLQDVETPDSVEPSPISATPDSVEPSPISATPDSVEPSPIPATLGSVEPSPIPSTPDVAN